jgi:hypothetical protein
MKVGEIIAQLQQLVQNAELYDWENPEFYISEVVYDEESNKYYVKFEKEE